VTVGPGDVLIVGAGPVGLTLANDLAQRGISFTIIDPLSEANPHAKAHGLQSRTLEALDMIGLGRAMVENSVHPEPTILNWQSGRYVGEMPAGGPPHHPYPYQLSIWQQAVEKVLEDHLVSAGHVVQRNCRLLDFEQDGTGVTARLDRNGELSELRAGWLVGCDGGRSMVRSTLGLEMSGHTEPGKWFIGEFDVDWDMPRDIIFINRHTTGSAIACFDPHLDRWHVWVTLLDDELPLTLENFNAVWRDYTGLEVEMSNPLWMHELRVNYGTVDHYAEGRVFLAGDAAHVHSSAGGQGLNTGVQDALNLGWKLSLAIEEAASPSLLQTYNDERVAEAHNVLALSERMHRVMYPTTPLRRQMSKLISLALRQPKLAERFAARRMSMLHINCTESSLSQNSSDQGTKDSLAGMFLPDAPCRIGGVSTSLYNALRAPSAELLLLSGESPTARTFDLLRGVANACEPLEKHVRVHYVVASERHAESASLTDNVIIDSGRYIRRALGTVHPEIIFVRPDGYVGLRSTDLRSQTVVDYLTRIYAGVPAPAAAAGAA
jgi:2-polyprenyl-6-methoxyphenol hydroxylase-like FAD-dependent oxidoreductase